MLIRFESMIDANERGNWGGIWSAPIEYSFVSDSHQSDITLTTQFGSWSYNGNGVEQNMPHLGHEFNGTS